MLGLHYIRWIHCYWNSCTDIINYHQTSVCNVGTAMGLKNVHQSSPNELPVIKLCYVYPKPWQTSIELVSPEGKTQNRIDQIKRFVYKTVMTSMHKKTIHNSYKHCAAMCDLPCIVAN